MRYRRDVQDTHPSRRPAPRSRAGRFSKDRITPWRLRIGASIVAGGVEFRVWAPHAARVDVDVEGGSLAPLADAGEGVWAGVFPGMGAGARYRYCIDGGASFPDPCSRSQPDGPHEASQVVDPASFRWTDRAWRGIAMPGLVIYELHVGTYTPEGTFDAIIGELDALQDLGVTAIELMPVAEFPGARNWGYDGVDLFAPSHVYGGPDALKRLIDAAHARGLAIILDVVYNHFGPDGNYLLQYAPDYLTARHTTPWGDAVNFDGPRSDMVRRFVVDNACYWLNEYHVDGLRLDATFAIHDDSRRHIIEEIATTARASVPGSRRVVIIAETHENDARYLRPTARGGFGLDAVCADDFHHAAHAHASHEHSGYYADYTGTIDEVARTIRGGWLFQGEYSTHFGAPRGNSADGLPAWSFIYSIQNHDQVGNHAFGRRFSHLVGTAMYRPWAALLALLPYTPMLFMGQEFAASSRFCYFTDHRPDLGRDVTKGRRAEFARAAGLTPAQLQQIPDPQAEATFLESKLPLAERTHGTGAQLFGMHRDLLALRRTDAVLTRRDRTRMDAFASGDVLFVHSWCGRRHRLIAANFGVAVDAAPGRLSLPPAVSKLDWRPLFSTEDRRYGGAGDVVRFDAGIVSLPPYAVAWLAAEDAPLPVRALRPLLRTVGRIPRWRITRRGTPG